MKKSYLSLALAALVSMTAAADWSDPYATIMIDPGHGGSDPGAGVPGNRYEAELVLEASLEMDKWLNAQNSPHKLTRYTNTDVSLEARRSASFAYDPWIFCSVHLNSAANNAATGTETWYYWNTNQRSITLANKVQAQLVAKLGLANRGVKRESWTVITAADYIPSILTEGLFINNPSDYAKVKDKSQPGFAAWVNGHLQGFYDFMESEKPGKVSPSPSEIPWTNGPVKDPNFGTLVEGWNRSENRGNALSDQYDARNIRNFAYLDGKLYCVYNNSEIIVLNCQTGQLLGRLTNYNIVGPGTLALCDVKAHNGKIYACNLSTGSDPLRIYCWDGDMVMPRLVLSTTDRQGCARLGDAMDIVGEPGVDAWYGFGFDTGSEFRIVEYHQTGPDSWTPKYTLGTNGSGGYIKVGANPRVYIWGSGNYWIDGNAINPCYLAAEAGQARCKAVNHYDGHTQGASHHEFYYNGMKYAAHFICTGEDYSKGQMRFFHDQAGNFSNNMYESFYPSDGLGSSRNVNGTGEVAINTPGKDYLETWVLSTTQGLAYFKAGNPPAVNPPTFDTSGLTSISTTEAIVVAESYFDIMGRPVANPQPGQFLIRRTLLSDGSHRTTKGIYR